MASGRIPFDEDLPAGREARGVFRSGVQFRKGLEELDRKLSRYNDAAAAIATDYGMAEADVPAFRDLVKRAAAEMADVFLTGQGVTAGSPGNTKTLLDSVG
jgi:hypothetical protein